MPRRRASALFITVLAVSLVAFARPALALYGEPSPGEPEFGFTVGYANVDFGGNSSLGSEDGLRFQPGFSIAPIQPVPQIRIGANVGTTLVLDNSTRTIISHGGQVLIAGSSSVPLWILEPELTLSWRQTFGARKEIFVEPGIAGGWAFGFLDIHDESGHSYHADSNTGYGKAFLRAGTGVPTAMFGVEASYLVGGDMDFGGNTKGEFKEFYIGFFGAIRF